MYAIHTIPCKITGQSCLKYPPYCAGDIVSVVLDMTKGELSFKKNRQDLGVAGKVAAQPYYLAVSLRGQRELAVKIKSSQT